MSENEINFSWTAQADFERLGLEKPVKLQKLKLAGGSQQGLTAIQLVFNDGIESPLIKTSGEYALTEMKLDPSKSINTVRVKTYLGAYIYKILFSGDDETGKNGYWD